MKPARSIVLGTILSLAACSGREPPQQGGIVVVTAKATPMAVKFASASVPPPVQPPPVQMVLPLQASAVLEAAIPATTELAVLAIEQEVGVLVTAQKARDPFHMADVDLSTPEDALTES